MCRDLCPDGWIWEKRLRLIPKTSRGAEGHFGLVWVVGPLPYIPLGRIAVSHPRVSWGNFRIIRFSMVAPPMCRDLCPDGWIWEKRLRLIPKTSRGAEGHFGLVWVVGPLPYIPLGRIAVSHPRVSWGNFRIIRFSMVGPPMCRDLCPDGWIWEKRLRLIPKTSRGAEGHFGLVWVVGPLPYIPLGRIAVSHPRVSWGNFRIIRFSMVGPPMCRDLCPDGWIWEKRLRLIPKTSRGAEGHFGLVWVVGPLPYIPLGRIAVSHPRVSWGNFRIIRFSMVAPPMCRDLCPDGWIWEKRLRLIPKTSRGA